MAPLKPRWPAHVSGTSPPMQGRATCGVHRNDPWTSEIVRIQKLDVEINVNPGLLIPLPAPLGCWLSWSALSYVQPQTSSWSQRVIEEAEQSESYNPSNDVAKPTVNHLQEQSPNKMFRRHWVCHISLQGRQQESEVVP